MELLFLAICILIFGAIIVPFLKKEYVFPFASICTIISTVTTSIPAISVLRTGNYLELKTVTSVFFGTNYFCIDALSSIFVLIISIMSVLGVIYANGYIKTYLKSNKPINSHCFFLMLLIASMLLVVTSFNALFFLVAWEIMSLSSFFLVMFDGNKKEVRKSAIKYLIYMHLSVIFIIAMFIMLSNTSGSLIFTDYTKILLENKHFANVIFLLGFIGFGIKAGFVPFHNWLPDAHPAAPSHVSGIMSGIMIKTGIYGILRILLLIGIPSKSLSYFVLTISLITVLYGVLYAITQHDIKKLLAYSSIENIGIIGVGIAVGMLGLAYNNNFVALFGFTGSFLHILNHSIFKQLLFFASGNIYLKTHTKNIEVLGGIIKKMPYTSLMFIIGSLAISGLPLFNGFISEILIYAAMLLGIPSVEMNLFIVFIISIAGLALAGTMAIVCFSKASGIMLLGNPRSDIVNKIDSEANLSSLIPMGILAISTFIIGIIPQYIITPFLTVTSLYVKTNNVIDIMIMTKSLTEVLSLCFCGFLLLIILLTFIRFLIKNKKTTYNTWGCGYNKPNSHMQYTPSSYDNLFVSTLKPLFKRISHIKKPKDLFPREAYFELEIEDIEEAYIVEPLVKGDEKLLAKFERIQNGNIQQYILFGLIFLIIAILGVIWIG